MLQRNKRTKKNVFYFLKILTANSTLAFPVRALLFTKMQIYAVQDPKHSLNHCEI